MKVILLVSFLFIITVPYSSAETTFRDEVPICDTVQLSYDLCNADLNCRTRLFIDMNVDDLDTFRYLFNQIVAYYRLRLVLDQYLCNNTGYNTTQQQTLWVVIMSNFNRFCDHVNEYFDGYLKRCICRPDKICIHENPNEKLFGYSAEQLYTWGILVLILLLGLTCVHYLRLLSRNYIDLFKVLRSLGVEIEKPKIT
jgi:hypothetical protein